MQYPRPGFYHSRDDISQCSTDFIKYIIHRNMVEPDNLYLDMK